MDDNSIAQIKKITSITIICILLIAIIPSLAYYINFSDFNVSKNPADWGTFGDYIGGVIGTCFGLLATILALVSIYISIKIAEKVQLNEKRIYEANAKREVERFEIEQTLLFKQFKPFPFINLSKFKESTAIYLENRGAGPLIVKNISVYYKAQHYPNFHKLLKENVSSITSDTELFHNSSPIHILTPGSSKMMLELKPKIALTDSFGQDQIVVRKVLKDCELKFEYEDIFETRRTYGVKLEFFE